MPFAAEKDTDFGDAHFDISKTGKRFVRATLKSYERTGTYVFLKVFKKAEHDYEIYQRVTLTLEEFNNITKKSQKIRAAATNFNDNELTNKVPPTKKPKLKPKDNEHELSD